MADGETLREDPVSRLVILVNRNAKLTPGKMAAQVAHAALEAHGVPHRAVVVLDATPTRIERECTIQVRDAGLTELEPGTLTCGVLDAAEPDMGLLLRDKAITDGPACLALLLRVHARDGYPLHLPPESVADFFVTQAQEVAWVAVHQGQIVGHVALHWDPDDPTLAAVHQAIGLPVREQFLVSRLFVDPDVRRAGVGRALLRHATAQARTLGRRAVLDVGQTLSPAVALYESEGWERVGDLHLDLYTGDTLDLWVYASPNG